MHGEKVDRARQLGIAQPDVPGFGGADRHLDVAFDVANLANELGRTYGRVVAVLRLAIPAQDVLVAHHTDQRARLLGVDVGGIAAELLLGLVDAVDPGARHQLQPDLGGGLRHVFATVGGAIGADILDLAGQHGEVALDLLLARLDGGSGVFADGGAQEGEDPACLGGDRVLVLGPRRVGDAMQRAFDIRSRDRGIEQTPPQQGRRRRNQKNHSKPDHERRDRSDTPPAVNARIGRSG